MDWLATAFDWNRARAFLVAAEEGSFSAAARALDVAQPTIGRQVAALERELGVALFERVGNALELTETGLALLEHVRAMQAAAASASLIAAGQAQALEGTVRIAASEAISAFLLPPIVDDLRRRHPRIEIELVVSNATSDLRRREADIAVRNFRPTEPDLVARKLGDGAGHFYASPDYLDRIGNPRTVEAFCARADLLGFEDTAMMSRHLRGLGFDIGTDRFPIRTENHLVQWQLAIAGAGVCIMMEAVGDAEPRVRRVLPDLAAPIQFPYWLTTHRELRTSQRIRVVFDLLAERLQPR
jgi:DNA-binding transcriptional LysR family regulator